MILLSMPQATSTSIGMGKATYVNALEYGCVGDGSTDNAIPLQNALNAAATSVLYIPAGTYVSSVTPTIYASCTVAGDGKGITTLQPTLANDGTVLNVYANNVTIRDLTIAGNGGGASGPGTVNYWGIYITATGWNGVPLTGDNIVIENVELTGFGACGIVASLGSGVAYTAFRGPYISHVSIHDPGTYPATAPLGNWGDLVSIQIGGGQHTVGSFTTSNGYFTPIVEGVTMVGMPAGLFFSGCLNPIARNCTATGHAGFGDTGFDFEGCSGGIFQACVADGFKDSNFAAYLYNDNCRFIGCTSRNAQWAGFNFYNGNYDISITDCRSINTGVNGTDFQMYYITSGQAARFNFTNIEIYNAVQGGNLAIDAGGVSNLDIRGARIYLASPLNPTIRINASGIGGMGTVIMRDIRMETGAGTNTQTAIELWHGVSADIAGNNYTNYASDVVTKP